MHARLLTHDIGPMLTARRLGLPFAMIPEGWLLPPEPDERDKRIAELQEYLKKLKSTYPNVLVSLTDTAGGTLNEIRMAVRRYDAMPLQRIQELVAARKAIFPKVEPFETRPPPALRQLGLGLSLGGHWRAPRADEIERYRGEYERWADALERFFEALPRRLSYPTRMSAFDVMLENAGSQPSDNAVVEIWSLGELKLGTPPKLRPVRIPKAPSPPGPVWDSSAFDTILRPGDFQATSISGLSRIHQPRDRHAFYWDERPNGYGTYGRLSCAEMRHGVEPDAIALALFVDENVSAVRGALRVRVMARNLPEPVDMTIPVVVVEERGNIEREVQLLMELTAGDLMEDDPDAGDRFGHAAE